MVIRSLFYFFGNTSSSIFKTKKNASIYLDILNVIIFTTVKNRFLINTLFPKISYLKKTENVT